jgi:hypothetical protein
MKQLAKSASRLVEGISFAAAEGTRAKTLVHLIPLAGRVGIPGRLAGILVPRCGRFMHLLTHSLQVPCIPAVSEEEQVISRFRK